MVRKVERKRYVVETKPGRIYFRRGGKYLHTFTAPEGTEEFDRQYWEVMTGKKQEAQKSWGVAIELLRHSDKWAALSPRYRHDLEPVLAYLSEKIGKRDVGRLTQADIYAAMDKNRHRVSFANYIPVAISLLSKLLIRRNWLAQNPAYRIESLAVPEARKKAHIPWTDDAVAKFRAEALPVPRLIFELGIGTVQRPDDWTRLTWGNYDGDVIKMVQNKTGRSLTIPCTRQLRSILDPEKASLSPHPTRTILAKKDGSRMTYRRMAEIMLKERERLDLVLYDLHSLRYRGVMELAWHGCDDDEIASYSGHSTKAMIIKYAGQARQVMRAHQAREKRQ